jgi:Ca-activated chloride channel family protein
MKNLKIFISVLSLAILYCFSATSHVVKGVVTDESGTPLIGANVTELGTQNGTVTDIDGKFSLTLLNPKKQIQVAYVGFNSQIITPDFTKDMNIVMKSWLLMEDVVVVGSAKNSFFKTVFNKLKGEKPSYQNSAPFISTSDMSSPENYKHFNDNPFKSTKDEPLSTMSIDVDRASYSNIRRFLNQGSMPPKDAVRVEEMINYFHYDYKSPSNNENIPFKMYTTYADCPWNQDHKLLHVAMKAKELDRKNLAASNMVFLIDISGSMQSSNKLPLVLESFKLLINQLSEKDVVSVVTYAGQERVVAEGVKGSDKETLYGILDELQSGGSTAGAAGIQRAYQLGKKYFISEGNNRVILATDGDFNVGVSSEGDLVRLIEEKRKTGIYLSILGYGMGNYQESKMQELSKAGNGNHFYIDNIEEAKKSLMHEYGSTMYSIANDVKIQIEFNPNFVKSYRVVGYENRQLANADFNDDTKDAGELGAGHIVTVIYEIVPKESKSNVAGSIDPLKYTKNTVPGSNHKELATIKSRYKENLGDVSKKMEQVIVAELTPEDDLSPSVKWSFAVAEFGLLLRNSEYKAKSNYKSLIARSKILADDPHKKECVALMEKASRKPGEMAQIIEE